jgi:catalase
MATKKTAGKTAENLTYDSSLSLANRGLGGEVQQCGGKSAEVLTTNDGTPVSDNQNSLRSGPRGASLLEDFVLQEKLSHFDRERIPERVVHARASLAHGHFELTHSLENFTTAKVLTQVGKKTPVIARLSTVAGSRGSADTVRDTRGFAVKFYTEEGNWDLVGNNIPVFFIQDAMKFPDLVHAVKPEPDSGFPTAASAHDTFWDFVSLMPESFHHLLWVMSDRGIPRSLRMMEGFGVHTFRLINKRGENTFVKYHWRPRLGVQTLLWDEAVKIAGADPDYHRKDLWEAIAAGDGPVWDLGVQLFTQKDADEFPFDLLDPTKLIPEEMVPVTFIGHMKLDRNPDNFFEENEMAAFSPMRIVPGMDFSNDPLLQGRLFSYLDTQLHRLGGPNFQQLPINRPKCPMANLQRDGFAQAHQHKGQVAYEPNSLDPAVPRATDKGFVSASVHPGETLARGRQRADSFRDHYTQPRLFFRSQTPIQQGHIAAAIVFELSKVKIPLIRGRVVGHLRNIDESLAKRVAAGLNLTELPSAPPVAAPVLDMEPSQALQTTSKWPETLEGRCVGILIDDGSDATFLAALTMAIEGAGAAVKIIAPKIGGARMSNKRQQPAHGQLAGSPSVLFDAVVVLLSEAAGAALAKEAAAVDFVRDAFGHLKAIAVSPGGQLVAIAAGIKPDKFVVGADDPRALVKAASQRAWDREPGLRQIP